jgi:hypothetical protein
MKKTILFYLWIIILSNSLSLFAQQQIVQPYGNDQTVRFFNKNAPSNALNVLNVGNFVNGVVINGKKMFVASNNVHIYDLPLPVNTSKGPVNAGIEIPTGFIIGMAIEPGTNNLFVTRNSNQLTYYTAQSNYTTPTSINIPACCVPDIIANLTFDSRGNLWATAFDGNTVGAAALWCFTKASNFTKSFIIGNPTGLSAPANQSLDNSVHSVSYLFSQPEGIVFDKDGNLWLANNNDNAPDNTAGTLVKIPFNWINTNIYSNGSGANPVLLVNSSILSNLGSNALIYYINQGKLGGLLLDGDILYINDQGRNEGSNITSSGTVWKWNIKQIFSTIVESGIKTTYPGNGTMALYVPQNKLHIKDNVADAGVEPNSSITEAWLSPSIFLKNVSGVPSNNNSEPITGGKKCYVYVRVHNSENNPSAATEKLTLYWAKASTGLNWPNPWTGDVISPVAMGGVIDTKDVPIINANAFVDLEFEWTPPNPNNYPANQNGFTNDHFCLLARIESSPNFPFGLTYPETTNTPTSLISNVLNNNKIAWRNISVGVPNVAKNPINPFIVANYGKTVTKNRITFELLDAKNKAIPFEKGKLTLSVQGLALDKLKEFYGHNDNFRLNDKGEITVLNPEKGLEAMPLQPNEVLPINILYTPTEPLKNYVLSVKQYVENNGEYQLIGGQAFVYGKVKGYNTSTETPSTLWNYWWILIIFLLLLLLWYLRKKK